MDALLNEYEQSSNLPVPDTDTLSDCDADVDSDLDTDEEVEDPSDALVNSTVQESSIECASDIEKDIAALTSSDLIDSGVKQKLTSFKHLKGHPIPLFLFTLYHKISQMRKW